MRTRHSTGLTRRTAEQLLDGAARSGPDHLTQVLSAAAAPARQGELAGEQAVMAAFEASLPFAAEPLSRSATPRKRKMPNLPLANLISMKMVAWSLAGVVAAGGAATAGTVAFSGSGSTSTGYAGASAPASGAADSTAPGTAAADGTSAPVAAAASSGSPGALQLTPGQLCGHLTSKVESVIGYAGDTTGKAGLSSVLANPAVSQVLATAPFDGLVNMVGNATAVPDYCGLLLALPTVPVPGSFTQIPASVLGQALSTLPATDMAGVLSSLPTGEVSQSLGEL